MNEYEVTYLTDPQVNEEARTELNSAVDAKVNELAGTIVHASASLRRRLAYSIEKTNSAFLRHLQIQLDPAKTTDFHTFLKKTKGILRFTLLQTPQRLEVAGDVLERTRNKKEPAVKTKSRPVKADKEVTMEDVEKGIEEALSEEVK